jgi:hypothetical protein
MRAPTMRVGLRKSQRARHRSQSQSLTQTVVFSGGEYAKQAALNGHADLACRAAGGEAVDVFVMVEIDVGPLAIKAGLPFDIAVQGYALYAMSFDEFLPSDDNPG